MWPKEVNKVEIIEEDSRGLIVDVDDYVARICPIPTGPIFLPLAVPRL